MTLSLSEWAKYRDLLSKVSQKAADEFQNAVWGANGRWKGAGLGAIDREELVDYAYALVTKYSEGSAELACQMYDKMAKLSGKKLPPAEPAESATLWDVRRSLNSAIQKSSNPEYVSSTLSRYVKQTSQDTTLKNAKRDGAEFAWVPSGDACPFCITLASNGWRRVGKNGSTHAEHIHNNCNCAYAVRFDSNTEVKGYDPDVYREMYDEAEGKSSAEKVNSMRRMQYQENKDVINAQKREAYAERNALSEQDRRINLSSETVNDKSHGRDLVLRKDENRDNVYISENATVKPKELSNIVSDLKESVNAYGINEEKFPRIVILDKSENLDVLASYNSVNNTFYVIPEVGNRDKIIGLQEGLAESANPKSTAYHEAWHLVQAERYRQGHGEITAENVKDYRDWLTKKSKIHLDKQGITSENVGRISVSADSNYLFGKYDEVEAEYNVILQLRGK